MRIYELFQNEDKNNVTQVNFDLDKRFKVNPTEPQKAYDAFIGDYLPFHFSNGMVLNVMDEDYDPNYTVWVINDANGKRIDMGEKADELVDLLQSMTHIPIEQDVANYDESTIQENQQLPQEVQRFVNSLTPDDVGVDAVGEYIVHYEGFTDQCNDGHDEESIDDVYADVYRDFDQRQGKPALARGVAHDDLGCKNNPVLYSVYNKLDEYGVPDYNTMPTYKLKKANKGKQKFFLPSNEPTPKGVLAIENFADGKKKGKSRPGRVKKAGASCKGSVTSLRAKAKKYSGERGKMYHWCANMKSGKKKSK